MIKKNYINMWYQKINLKKIKYVLFAKKILMEYYKLGKIVIIVVNLYAVIVLKEKKKILKKKMNFWEYVIIVINKFYIVK